ncbi:MAG: hypothetical protein S4CHLAM20_09620 [Chlamydiia bacterium]|nr:hypothetical protein [Chlamydiia bacterium]
MPIYWKILSKKFLINILFFTVFFVALTIFFKVSRLTKYFVSGIDLKELFLLLGIFLYRCFPFAFSITCLISAYIGVSSLKKNNEIKAFSSLGLSPQKLFSPLIILSIFLTICNLSISFVLSPYINKKLNSALDEKKQHMELLPSFSRRFNRDNLFLNIDTEKGSNKGSNFLLINTKKALSWMIADYIVEEKDGVYFSHPSTFVIASEKDGNDTIMYSHNDSIFFPKSAIFSLFPKSILRIDPIDYSGTEKFSIIVYSLHPILFTLYGILLGLGIWPLLSAVFLLYTFVTFTITTVLLWPTITYLSLLSFALIIPLYFFNLRAYKRGIR